MIYIYRCPQCGYQDDEVEHGMTDDPVITCPDCGVQMRRRPQKVRVNWGGIPPSAGDIHPTIKRHIADAPRRREEVGS